MDVSLKCPLNESSRGFTAEEAKMHEAMLKRIGTVRRKVFKDSEV